jgi:ribosome-binding factor A
MARPRHQPAGTTPYPRTARVNEVLRQVLAEELERLGDVDDELRLLTVTAVATAADLRHATVYLASLSAGAAEALAAHRVHLQGTIGREVRLKRTPQLSFAEDPAVTGGARIDAALRRIHGAPGSTADQA